ncbi:hypothetical protein [Alkalihalobacillus sp. CinArs1]|uniref:hypothetical protein n=1 Tax=Alkalihalobacillus sp. CinArs1 TaxID=2995314 RepID=UPI0022DD46E1|nr:hypothetical protein [Alkalihalobacillus sp. CinArs1]
MDHKKKHTSCDCEGCVCSVLRKLSKKDCLFDDKEEQLFTLVKKNGLKVANLRFIKLDPKTCCAKFKSFTGQTIQVWDCRKLAGIIKQNVPPIPPQPPVECMCRGTITAGQSGTPETFANNRVDFLVPSDTRRNVNGRISICPSCSIDQSVFQFRVPPSGGSMFGFNFEADIFTSVVCAMENSILTVCGVGTATPMGPNGLDGVFTYEVILTEGAEGTIKITLYDENSNIVFETAPFTPSVGGGKAVTIEDCP